GRGGRHRHRLAAVVGARLGRGPGGGRPVRTVPADGATGDLSRDGRPIPRRGTLLPLLLHARGARGTATSGPGPRGDPRLRRPVAFRFRMPEEDMVVHDLIRGDTHFPANDLRDFVILRSDGTPTYLLAAAVDDVRMEMTHVIRGEDLHPSTPRQLRIMEALGATRVPHYAHLPLIVGADHKPLSK